MSYREQAQEEMWDAIASQPDPSPLVRFELSLDMGNDAMRCASHVADALGEVAAKLYSGQTQGPVVDGNGNAVGSFVMLEKGMR